MGDIENGPGASPALIESVTVSSRDNGKSLSPSPERAKRSSPEPAKRSCPEPAKSDSSEPAKSDSSEPAKSDSPEPAKSDSPEPAKRDSPEPAKSDSPEPAKSDSPEPASASPEPVSTPLTAEEIDAKMVQSASSAINWDELKNSKKYDEDGSMWKHH